MLNEVPGRISASTSWAPAIFRWKFIAYESGPGPQVTFILTGDRQPLSGAEELAKLLNISIAAIEVDWALGRVLINRQFALLLKADM
jgi:hypothetical protein